MTLQFTPRPGCRKPLAALITETLGVEATYLGAPSFSYTIGPATLGRDWRLTGLTDRQERPIIDAANTAGYGASPEQAGLTITLPAKQWDERLRANLTALLASKGHLIIKALGTTHVGVEFDDDGQVARFAWFGTLPSPQVADAAQVLIIQMVAYARRVQRVNPAPTAGGNEKYVMRCFLLCLGFIGNDYRAARRVLLANLDGNSAWRTPPAPNHPTGTATVGARVRLDADSPDEEGRVFFIDDQGTIHVDWHNGSAVGLIPGRDRYTLLES